MKQREYTAHVTLVLENISLEELTRLEEYVRGGFDGSQWKLYDLHYVLQEGHDRTSKSKKGVSKEELLEAEKSKGASCGN